MDLKFVRKATLVFISWGAPHKAHKASVDLIAGGQEFILAAGIVLSRYPI